MWLSMAILGDAAGQEYNKLANILVEKLDLSYGEVMGWVRCKLSFALVRLAIMCIHGACSRMHSPVFDAPLDVQIAEAPSPFVKPGAHLVS